MLHFKTSLFRKGEDLWWYWSDQIRYWKKKEWGKENRQESYRSCQRNTVYLHITHYLITSSSSCQTLRAGREKESAKKKGFHNLLIILQDVCPYLGFRKSWNSFRWDTSGLVTSSCSGLTQRRLVLDFLWLMICWGTLTRCTVILPIRHTSTDGSGLKRIKYVSSLQR